MSAIDAMSHLSADAAEIVGRSSADRTRAIWATRWVDYPRATQLLAVLNSLLDRPRATRMPSVAIYADSGMGKTMLMKRFLACHQTHFDRAAFADKAPRHRVADGRQTQRAALL